MRIALMAVLAAVSTPAFAGDGTPKAQTVDGQATQTAAQPTTAEGPAERKICRRIEASESRVAAKKVCLTAEQWKQRDRENSAY
ncbi:MAG: hypothetical protein HOP91_03135 [Sphingomonas sp.]|nr:hypothetical protein [Sphingomonas sp.]